MVYHQDVIATDLKHIWHPCMQMHDFEEYPPILVERAEGSLLHTNHGPLIDGISSWWCKSLGHRHPAVVKAIETQLGAFEQVMGANTTHAQLAKLGEILARISGKQHVFFASDGSCAVEIAMKLAIHAKQIVGQSQRRAFISLENAYHGETIATMSVSDLGIYKAPYASFGVPCHFIRHLPYVSGSADPLWSNAKAHWDEIEPCLDTIKESVCAVLVEPIIQGAAGMRVYSADFLKRLAQWAKANDIYLIADEIMTGIGRTGTWFASEHAHVSPDFICVSKGLTAGALPLSGVLIDDSVYQLFYGDYGAERSFLHSHTHSANALAVSAALATLHTIESQQLLNHAQSLAKPLQSAMQAIADETGKLSHVRSFGVMAAAELDASTHPKTGKALAHIALKHGALLRPIGNTLYWLLPINSDEQTIRHLAKSTLHSIYELYN